MNDKKDALEFADEEAKAFEEKLTEETKEAWTEYAKVETGNDDAVADFADFDTAVAEYAKTRVNKYDEEFHEDSEAPGDATGSTDGESADGANATGEAAANDDAAGAN